MSSVSESAEGVANLKVSDARAHAQQTGATSSKKGKKRTANQFTLKTPKGTKDWHPADMAIRHTLFDTVTSVFKLHGGVTIDTPVFELKEILAGKYGEDSKLIYDLEDQGGELCSLRYDLTVPFARFLAMNGNQYPTIKRYHVAKVYRRDQPAMNKGRMREFYQCDFDIAGQYDAMLPDAECLSIANEVLTKLDIGPFTIKVNHRKILDAIFRTSGVPQDKVRTISSAVDKLDKSPWADVKKEMTVEKGLDDAVADKIGTYVNRKGGRELVAELQNDSALLADKAAVEGLDDMLKLFEYLDAFKATHVISFDLSLARGLDYYTGVIYEAVTAQSAAPKLSPEEKAKLKLSAAEDEDNSVGVGSVAAGGRYDDLVGMFSGSSGASGRIPCVGISFGVERLFSILRAKSEQAGASRTGKSTQVFVMALGAPLLAERLALTKDLWDNGIAAEFMYKAKPKTRNQFDQADRDEVPFVCILAPDELADGNVRVKRQLGRDVNEGKGDLVQRDSLVQYLRDELAK